MNIPKKITPDHLKDTIVEIRFDTELPLDLISGIALTLLRPIGFQYTPRLSSSSISVNVGQGQHISIGNDNGSGLFIKDAIRIQFTKNVMAFNCFEAQYVGWEMYSKTIKEIVQLLVLNKLIKSFNRISFRYISEFESIDIIKNLRAQISLDETTGLTMQNSIIRLSKETGDTKVFATLTNRTKKGDAEVSLVDINVFENLQNISDIHHLEEILDKVHLHQKETFFNLISKEFLASLNPEY